MQTQQRIQPTEHERKEFKRYAAACRRNDLLPRAQLFDALAELSFIDLPTFDKATGQYRAWLCFGEFVAEGK